MSRFAIAVNSSRVNTLPDGFIGEFSTNIFVRGENDAASSAIGNDQCGGCSRTAIGVQPRRRITGA